MPPDPPRIATGPDDVADWVVEAVEAGGGHIVAPGDAEGLVWMSPTDVTELQVLLRTEAAAVRWVQLPWAGVERQAAAGLFDDGRTWTCGKGVYAEPVAEHALALGLAGLRHLVAYARADAWGGQAGTSLHDGAVTILGAGGITEALLRLLQPFRVRTTVVRRHPEPVSGATRTVTSDRLHEALATADLVVLALALTPETTGIIGAPELAAMQSHAWLVNVARGAHIRTDDLLHALQTGSIGGAALDVTDPEPLPAGHPLWTQPRCLITPHTANTPEMARGPLAARITDNVARFAAGRPLVGPVDATSGY